MRLFIDDEERLRMLVLLLLMMMLLLLLLPVQIWWQQWILIAMSFSFCVRHSARHAIIEWQQSYDGAAWFSWSLWPLMWKGSSIYVMILIWIRCGFLLRGYREGECSQEPLRFNIQLWSTWLVGAFAFWTTIETSRVRLRPRKLFRRRPEWQKWFVRGSVVSILLSIVAHSGFAYMQAFWWGHWVGDALVILLVVIIGIYPIRVFRNAAVIGLGWHFLLELYWQADKCDIWINTATTFVPGFLLILAAGTIETIRDRLMMECFIVMTYLSLRAPGSNSAALMLIGYFANSLTSIKRDMAQWDGAVGFLKFSEIRRRRRADSGFVLQRRQDTDLEIYGDPTKAMIIVVISHPWLTPTHADPEGLHLDIAISRIEAVHSSSNLCGFGDEYLWLDSEGDFLVFFDMSSLYQWERITEEEREFRRALGLMEFLYHSFEVLVIPDIPDKYGYDLSYMDKGWCWSEVNSAFLGDKLDKYSPQIKEQVKRERQMLEDSGISLQDALLGVPSYPDHVLEKGKRQELLEFRKTQTIQGKVFTNGSLDFPIVAQILATVRKKQDFLKHCKHGEVAAVRDDFRDDAYFSCGEGGGLTREGFANTVFDGAFQTPLHIAVQSGSVELVEFLMEQGAQPKRNFYGELPWQDSRASDFGIVILIRSAAAQAARSWAARVRALQFESPSLPSDQSA